MSTLFGALDTAGSALDAYQQALNVVQNNITNSSTPGYASQSANLVAQPFDTASGLAGGVAARGLISARDEFADEEVNRQLHSLGMYEAQSQATSELSANFDATGNTGVTAELNQLFSSFSAWSIAPNSPTAQQQVLATAGNLASGVHSLASSLQQAGQSMQTQIGHTVQQINTLTAQIQQLNIQRGQSLSPDPGLDAQMHSALEQLSELVNFSQITQPNGMVTVILSGGTPLVLGNQQYALSANALVPAGSANPKAPPSSQILDSQGNDITAQITGGKLGGLLDAHNRVLASLIGDGSQAGSLNQFAKTLADTVNNILESGTVSTAAGAAKGVALFSYDNSDPTLAAGSLAVNSSITPSQLAPVDSSGNSNGNALQLASLANSTASGGISGQTFGQFFSSIESFIGNENATANTNQQSQTQVVTQTRALRDQVSGVSLDDQAVQMMQFQKSYQAAARLITVIDSLTQTTVNMIQ